jgi:hypothetical protein
MLITASYHTRVQTGRHALLPSLGVREEAASASIVRGSSWKSSLTFLAAAAVAAALAAPAVADSGQLAASAGLSPSAASALTLTEIAQAKFNRGTRRDDRQVIVRHHPASQEARATLARNAGLPAEAQVRSLTEIAAAKFNRETGGDDQQRIDRSNVTMSARDLRDNDRWAQLIASAGLSRSEASSLSLTEIAKAKFKRDTRN